MRAVAQSKYRRKYKKITTVDGEYTRTFNSWMAMRQRCYYKKNNRYEDYGGRGITVTDRWLGDDGFANFLADMGERPAEMTLDRKENDLGYYKDNCRWATVTTQMRNQTRTVLEHHEPAQIRWLRAEGFTYSEIGRFFGIGKSHVGQIVNGQLWKEQL